MKSFEGRVAVVTGAASGIGRGLVDRFVAEGMKVVLADVQPDALDAAVKELTAAGAEVVGVVTDVSKTEEVFALAEKTIDAFGAVHVLCNNAGVDSGGLFEDVAEAAWNWVMGVDFFGVLNGCRAFLPHLKREDEAHIVNTGSLSSLSSGILTVGPYVAAKFAVLGLTENLAVDLHETAPNVGVSILLPGAVRTNMPDAERNKPRDLEVKEAGLRARVTAGIRAAAAGGLEPAVVADLVIDGIRSNDFYIMPHRDSALDAVSKRLAWMTNGERPIGRLPGQ